MSSLRSRRRGIVGQMGKVPAQGLTELAAHVLENQGGSGPVRGADGGERRRRRSPDDGELRRARLLQPPAQALQVAQDGERARGVHVQRAILIPVRGRGVVGPGRLVLLEQLALALDGRDDPPLQGVAGLDRQVRPQHVGLEPVDGDGDFFRGRGMAGVGQFGAVAAQVEAEVDVQALDVGLDHLLGLHVVDAPAVAGHDAHSADGDREHRQELAVRPGNPAQIEADGDVGEGRPEPRRDEPRAGRQPALAPVDPVELERRLAQKRRLRRGVVRRVESGRGRIHLGAVALERPALVESIEALERERLRVQALFLEGFAPLQEHSVRKHAGEVRRLEHAGALERSRPRIAAFGYFL